MRRPIVAANWKMHKVLSDALDFVRDLRAELQGTEAAEVVVAPPFPWLVPVGEALGDSGVALAAQNVHAERQGAFTGEVSAPMLAAAGCRYVIVGHSERRALFGESDEVVAEKLAAVQREGMDPILCVGETLEQREAGRTESVLAQQLERSLARLDPARADALVVAYEPVWAIGTGRTATPGQAQEAHAFLRDRLRKLLGGGAPDRIRIQYGGSVKPENAASLLDQPDLDGALVGGASLDPRSFYAILCAGSQPQKGSA